MYFYPRSPCGERLLCGRLEVVYLHISIHALLAESDWCGSRHTHSKPLFLSTLSLRRATRAVSRQKAQRNSFLSTLSLRRATYWPCVSLVGRSHFYPRSPCGERLSMETFSQTLSAFLSTLSLRRATTSGAMYLIFLAFLSTLSLRRATMKADTGKHLKVISIHALLAESDPLIFSVQPRKTFLSTLSLRRATQ